MKKIFLSIAVMAFSLPIVAETYWLNISGEPVIIGQTASHSLSIPVTSLEQCERALAEYAQMDKVHYISCSRLPLPKT